VTDPVSGKRFAKNLNEIHQTIFSAIFGSLTIDIESPK
jgi:hypothetical protein